MRAPALVVSGIAGVALLLCGCGAASGVAPGAARPAAGSGNTASGAVSVPGAGPEAASNPTAAATGSGIAVGTPSGEIERSVSAAYTVPQNSFLQAHQGQLNTLTNQVTYATASIQLSERGATAAAPQPPVTAGVIGGWNNALTLTAAILEVLVSLLPLLVLGAVALVFAWRISRRAAERRVPQAPPSQ